ncbi:MAG: hypothetical protein ACO1RX_15910 [Candidatus Sericytochromatia bacterium]
MSPQFLAIRLFSLFVAAFIALRAVIDLGGEGWLLGLSLLALLPGLALIWLSNWVSEHLLALWSPLESAFVEALDPRQQEAAAMMLGWFWMLTLLALVLFAGGGNTEPAFGAGPPS